MNQNVSDLEALLTELSTAASREDVLLSRIATFIEHSRADLPEHLARTCAMAVDVFGPDAARFLTAPHVLLEGEMPLRVAENGDGARRVQDLLGRINYGTVS